MVQKVRARKTWIISSICGSVSFISFNQEPSSFLMRVLTSGGSETRLVLLARLAGPFSIVVMPKSVVLILGEYLAFEAYRTRLLNTN